MADIPLQIGGGGFGNALVRGYQVGALRRQADEFDRRKALGPDVQSAIGGDSAALGRVAAVDPDYALKIGPILDRLDANKQAVLKRAADFTTQMGMGVLNSSPETQASAYEAGKAEAQRQGHDISKWPQQWGPDAKAWVEFNVNKAVPVAEWFKQRESQPVPIGGGGMPMPGGQAAGGGGAFGNAIANTESAGTPNNGYSAVGPVANGKGNRAYGRYQVMDFNVGPWTQEVLGKPMTPQEFVANPQAQDAVFNAKFGQYVQKYGSPQAAARAWFAGEGGMSNAGASDVNGMTVANYEKRFNSALGGQAAPRVPGQIASPPPAQQVAQGDTPQADASGTPLPPSAPLPPETKSLLDYVKQVRPGWQIMGSRQTKLPSYDAQGRLHIRGPDGREDYIEVPKPTQPTFGWQQQGGQLVPVPGGPNDPETIRREAEARRQNMTEDQSKAAGFADRMSESEKNIRQFGDAALSPQGKLLEGVPIVGNYLQTPEYRQFEQARRDFINAQLRRESGAVISQAEFDNAERQYFPRPGDDKDTLAQKQRNREIALESMKRSAGPVYNKAAPSPAEKARNDFNAAKPPAPPPPPGALQMPRLSPQDAAKLPSGTPFVGEDGIPRVRH